jgi:hypothetical protein
MSDLPHLYSVKSVGTATGALISSSNNLPDITVAPPLQLAAPVTNGRPKIYLWLAWLTAFYCHLGRFLGLQS